VIQPDRPQMEVVIWRMRIACRMTKARYLIFTAFPWPQSLRHTNISCVAVCWIFWHMK